MVLQRSWKFLNDSGSSPASSTEANRSPSVANTDSNDSDCSNQTELSMSTSLASPPPFKLDPMPEPFKYVTTPQMAESVLQRLKHRLGGHAVVASSSSESAMRALELLRISVQSAFDKEIDVVVRKYVEEYFKPAFGNIKENLGESVLAEDALQKMSCALLENAKAQYSNGFQFKQQPSHSHQPIIAPLTAETLMRISGELPSERPVGDQLMRAALEQPPRTPNLAPGRLGSELPHFPQLSQLTQRPVPQRLIRVPAKRPAGKPTNIHELSRKLLAGSSPSSSLLTPSGGTGSGSGTVTRSTSAAIPPYSSAPLAAVSTSMPVSSSGVVAVSSATLHSVTTSATATEGSLRILPAALTSTANGQQVQAMKAAGTMTAIATATATSMCTTAVMATGRGSTVTATGAPLPGLPSATGRRQIFWNTANISVATKFVLDVQANQAFGFGTDGKERLASKHPELIRYLPDSEDRDYLITENIIAEQNRNSRFLFLIYDEVHKLYLTNERYRNKPNIDLKLMHTFHVPESMIDKMKLFFVDLNIKSRGLITNSFTLAHVAAQQMTTSASSSAGIGTGTGTSTNTSTGTSSSSNASASVTASTNMSAGSGTSISTSSSAAASTSTGINSSTSGSSISSSAANANKPNNNNNNSSSSTSGSISNNNNNNNTNSNSHLRNALLQGLSSASGATAASTASATTTTTTASASGCGTTTVATTSAPPATITMGPMGIDGKPTNAVSTSSESTMSKPSTLSSSHATLTALLNNSSSAPPLPQIASSSASAAVQQSVSATTTPASAASASVSVSAAEKSPAMKLRK